MVVGLQRRAKFALRENDQSVEHLVELAEVEDPAVEGKSLVPQAARIGAQWLAVARQSHARRVCLPRPAALVVDDAIAVSRRAVHPAHGIHGASNPRRPKWTDHCPAQGAIHAPAGPGRVHGEKDVMENDEGLKGARLADSPWLLARRLVVGIEQLDRHGVHDRDRDGDHRAQPCLVDALGDVEGWCEWSRACLRWR